MSQHKLNVICIIGGPGAGKTSLSSALCNKIPNSVTLKSGSLLRASLTKNSLNDTSKHIASVIDKGGLVDDEVVSKVINHEILHRYQETLNIHSIIIDGYPRTTWQLSNLDPSINLAGVIVLEAPELVLEKRCKIRNLKTERIDDLQAPVTERIHDYYKHIVPLMALLEERGVPFVSLSSCGSMEETLQQAISFGVKLALE